MRTNRSKRLWPETLETRRLLAADLSIHIDEYSQVEVGEEAQLNIRVKNNGTSAAPAALVQSRLTDKLENPAWTRQRFPGVQAIDGAEATLVIESPSGLNEPVLLGDLNGDGRSDIGVWRDKDRYIIFGGEQRLVATFNDLGELTLEGGSLTKIEVSSVDRFSVWQPLGDINSDGFDDILINGVTVFGRRDFPSIISLEHSRSFRVSAAGDINGDGLMESFESNSDSRETISSLGIRVMSPLNRCTSFRRIRNPLAHSITWVTSTTTDSMTSGSISIGGQVPPITLFSVVQTSASRARLHQVNFLLGKQFLSTVRPPSEV